MEDLGYADLNTFVLFRFLSKDPCYTKLFRVKKMDGNDKENDVVILGENDDEYTRIPLLVSILFHF